MNIFLSASVPIPRAGEERYFQSADVVAIRDAVKALSLFIAPRGTIVFGGHPAITPLIANLAVKRFGEGNQPIKLYMSKFFEGSYPPESASIKNVVLTERADDLNQSLDVMRGRMLTDTPFTAAVFIGGMKGVIDEYDTLRKVQPNVPCFPIASTGGAALEIYKKHGPNMPELERELTYPTLFRHILTFER